MRNIHNIHGMPNSEFEIPFEHLNEIRHIEMEWNKGITDRISTSKTLDQAFSVRHQLQYSFKKHVASEEEWNIHLNTNFEVIKELIYDNSTDLSKVLDRGNTYLHQAVRWYGILPGMFEIVKLLVEKGIDMNRANDLGDTPLFEAVKSGSVNDSEMIAYLISNGADVKVINKKGENVLHKTGENLNPNLETINLLIQHGSDINAQTLTERKTPLMYFYRGKQYSSVLEDFNKACMVLIKSGCDLNLQDSRGKTILHIATSKYDGNSYLTKKLLSEGIDISLKDNTGYPFTYYLTDKRRKKLGL